jgi:hypothetical protein
MRLAQFYAEKPIRERSPEWDFGVHWRNGARDWPRYRVSWIVRTGEVYAFAPQDDVILLGVVPSVGEYPYAGTMENWAAFKNEQPIERLMKGWAEESNPQLDWVRRRLEERATDAQ